MTLGQAANFYRFVNPKERHRAVRSAVSFLRKKKFDAIAVRGVSGAVAGSILAHLLKKPLVVVRCEGWIDYQATEEPRSYVIVDDLIDTGATVKAIKRAMKREFKGAKFKGAYLYQFEEWRG